MIMKMATITKLNTVLAIVSIMMEVTSPLCTPLDTSWTRYKPTIPPMEFKGQSTSGGCSGTNCTKPAVLGDGYHGTADLNIAAAHAWNTNVTIIFIFPEQVRVRGVNIYFYNIPTMNISLPTNTTLTSPLHKGVTIEGNQDFIEDNCQLCNVTLIPNITYQGMRFTIRFQFSNKSNIVWLLLTEVELCTGSTISTTGTTVTTSNTVATTGTPTVTTGRIQTTTTYITIDGALSTAERTDESQTTTKDITDTQTATNFKCTTNENDQIGVHSPVGTLIGTHLAVFLIGLGVGLLLMGVITACIVKKIKSRQINNQPKAAAGPIYEDVDDCKVGQLDTMANEAYGMVSSIH